MHFKEVIFLDYLLSQNFVNVMHIENPSVNKFTQERQ